MIMPVETFKSPVDTDIRLYKIDGEYYVPISDIQFGCGYTVTGGGNIIYQKLREKFHLLGKSLNLSVKKTGSFSHLVVCVDVIPALSDAISEYKSKNISVLQYFNTTYRPQVEKIITLFEEEILPFVELLKEEDEKFLPVEKVAQAFGIDSPKEKVCTPVEKPKEEILPLFASRVVDDLRAKVAALEAENARLKAEPPAKTPQDFFVERTQDLIIKKSEKLADVVKLADLLNASLDWLCGRDEYVKE